MAINALDLSGNTFTLTPMNMTDKAKVLLESIISNIEYDKQAFEAASTDVQDKVNEIGDVLNNLTAGVGVDIDELQNKIEAIIALQSEAGEDSFVGLFTKLFDELNRREELTMFTLPVSETVNGTVGVDLTAYGFSNVDEYEITAQVRTKGQLNITASVEKASPTLATITLRDQEYVIFDDNAGSFFVADNADNKVDVTITIGRTAKPLFATVTEVDGDVDEFGQPLVPAVEGTGTVDATTAVYSLAGTKGTEANTVITIANSDDTVNFTVNSVDGEDAFTIVSDGPVKLNGSITVYKTVNGVNAPSRTFNYVSPLPQLVSTDLVVDSTTKVLSVNKPSLAGLTMTIVADGDNTTATTITIDASGVGSTNAFVATLGDNQPHSFVFSVTTAGGLTSAEVTKTVTIAVDGNLSEL